MADSPFAPGFGVAPPYAAGRGELTDDTVRRLRRGPSHEYHTIVLGPRGVGKTVWLNQLAEHVRRELGAVIIAWNAADPDRRLREAVNEQAPDAERRLTSRLRRGAGKVDLTVRASPGGVGAEATVWGNRHTDADPSATHRLERLGRLAEQRRRMVLLRVDELQGGDPVDLISLGAALQTVSNEARLPVALVAVGLPSTRDTLHDLSAGARQGPSAGFLERQDIHWIGNLDRGSTLDALELPLAEQGWTIDADALDRMAAASNGYPYAIQLIGHHTWMAAARPGHITSNDVEAGMALALERMVRTVYEPRWRSMSESDRRYVRVAATLRDAYGDAPSTAVSTELYGSKNAASQNRRRLIDKHHVLAPGRRGSVHFTIPGFAEWALAQRVDVA